MKKNSLFNPSTNSIINTKINCPLCYHNNTEKILVLTTGNFDQSILYDKIRIYTCLDCGHVFNHLSTDELKNLTNYYTEEKSLTNANSQEKNGDLPGSNNPRTIERYQKLFDFIKKYLPLKAQVLDIGFSKGGFNKFLGKLDYKNLFDLDVVDNCLGKALPMDLNSIADNSLDCLVMDQVMEHLTEPVKAFEEARRVLKLGGILCLGVPDANRYNENHFFDFYWFLLREHLQHFDLAHVNLLAAKTNFELIDNMVSDLAMMSETMIMPNLNIIFKLGNKPIKKIKLNNNFELVKKIKKCLADDLVRLKGRRKFFSHLAKKQQPLYVWGMSREFFYLYEAAGLKYCNIKGLIDTNPYKQRCLKIDGRSIQPEGILKQTHQSDRLLITATAHSDPIETKLKQGGCEIGFINLKK